MIKVFLFFDGLQWVANIEQNGRVCKTCQGSKTFVEQTANEWSKQYECELIKKQFNQEGAKNALHKTKKDMAFIYIVQKSFKNKNHFEVTANFNLEVFFTPRCKQGRKNTPIKIRGVKLYVFQMTRNDLKDFRENNVFTEINDFNKFF